AMVDARGLRAWPQRPGRGAGIRATRDGLSHLRCSRHGGGRGRRAAGLGAGAGASRAALSATTITEQLAMRIPLARERASTVREALAGIAIGVELMCRASLVAPKRIHKAGFHPTAVLGAIGAAAGVATALRLPNAQWVNALGVVGSFASGIIEYLAEGSWTKRLHP